MDDKGEGNSDVQFVRRLLLAVLILGLAWLAWELRFILVLVFGAVLLAVVLRSSVHALQRWLHIPEGAALALTVLSALAVIGGMAFLFGQEIGRQTDVIAKALPAALEKARDVADDLGMGGWAERQATRLADGAAGGDLGGLLLQVGDGLTNLIILVVGAIFLAARPGLYRTGLIKLVPSGKRSVAATALDDCEVALRLWFKGRLLAMVLVGLLVTLGLWLIGVPSFLALGLLAGLLEIIPFFGPLLAAVPGVMLALLVSPTHALLAAGLYLVIQQAEGNLITPIIQQHAVELPPALLLFSLLMFGVLFGVVGVILAEPLTVAVFVLVKELYVQRTLGTSTPIPGKDKGED